VSELATDPLEAVIRAAGEAWLIDWYTPPNQAIPHLRLMLEQADERLLNRFGPDAPRLTGESLLREHQANPHKVRALLQVLGSVASPDILVMVWRILQGMNIASIQMEYDQERVFRLRVTLSSSYDQAIAEHYESTDIDDAVVLRHFGIMKMDDKPCFDGFYPLNVGA